MKFSLRGSNPAEPWTIMSFVRSAFHGLSGQGHFSGHPLTFHSADIALDLTKLNPIQEKELFRKLFSLGKSKRECSHVT